MCLPWSHQGPVLFQSLTSASSVDSEPLQGRAGSVFFYQLSVPSPAHVVLYKCLLHEQTKRHRPNVRPSFYQSGGLIRLCPGGSRRAARVPRGTLFPGPRRNAAPASHPVLVLALSTPTTQALRHLAMPSTQTGGLRGTRSS